MLNLNYSKNSDIRKPIRSYDGKVIGSSDGIVFRKTIKGSLHILRCPPAIAIDAEAYEQEIKPTHERIEVMDTESDKVYTISVDSFERNKEELDRGHGRQVYARLRYWVGESRNVRQLTLW